jgi:hypothetical protein
MAPGEQLRFLVASYLVKIEKHCEQLGAPMEKQTLIMRNSDKSEMFIVMSNEEKEGMKIACDLALGEKGTLV